MGLNMCVIATLLAVCSLLITPNRNVGGIMADAVESIHELSSKYNASNGNTIVDDEDRHFDHIYVRNILFIRNGLEHFQADLNRTARDADTCKIPSKTEHSTLLCVQYPKYIICKHMCTFGHTLNKGISRDYKCIHEENKWVPSAELEQCLPFIDCTLKIVGSGRYTCNTTDAQGNGPVCRIVCNHYEDKPRVAEASYQCDMNGNWSPKLPHCVAPRGGKRLVPPPKGIKYLR